MTDVNLRVVSAKRKSVNPRAEIARSNKQSHFRIREHVKDLSITKEVFTIFGGQHKAASSHNASYKYVRPRRLCIKQACTMQEVTGKSLKTSHS